MGAVTLWVGLEVSYDIPCVSGYITRDRAYFVDALCVIDWVGI